ncbi:MAG: CpaF family protein [Lachnospiraceae bacterium]
MSMANKTFFQSIRNSLISKINFAQDIDNESLEALIDNEITEVSKSSYISLKTRLSLRNDLFYSIRGLDILEEFLCDDSVTEIMINGYNHIFIEKNGKIHETQKSFSSKEKLEDIIQQIVSSSNKRVNRSSPIVDTRLSDGSRVNVVLDPISIDGPALTIRRFPKIPLTIDYLTDSGSISHEAAHMLKLLVAARYNIFISGSTGSGKTTFLNILSGFIPSDQRVITIEDSAELQLTQLKNLIRLESRPANMEGDGEISIRELIKTSLRMRPDRIIVGEVRGGETLDMLQAMNTGHDGSLSTGHGNNPVDMISRLETMILMNIDMPITAIRSQIASAIDIMVHLGRLRDGSRRVINISEILSFKDSSVILNPLFLFKETGEDSNGKILGILEKQNTALSNTFKLNAAGIKESDL